MPVPPIEVHTHHLVKRLVIIGSLLAGVLVACGGGDDAPPKAQSTSAPATPSPTPSPEPPSCTRGEAASDKIVASSLVLVDATGAKFDRSVKALERNWDVVLYLTHDIERYLEDYGPYEAGENCLEQIAAAMAVAVAAIGVGDTTAADAYRLLLVYYPESHMADEAEVFLHKHGYPVP